jgi:hypothetical protein
LNADAWKRLLALNLETAVNVRKEKEDNMVSACNVCYKDSLAGWWDRWNGVNKHHNPLWYWWRCAWQYVLLGRLQVPAVIIYCQFLIQELHRTTSYFPDGLAVRVRKQGAVAH